MKLVINRKYSYPLIMGLCIVISLFRFMVSKNEPWYFHTNSLLSTLIILVAEWEALVWINIWIEKLIPHTRRPLRKLLVQVGVTTISNILITELYFLILYVIFDYEVVVLSKGIIYLNNFFIAVVFNLIFFGVYYFTQWKNDLIAKSKLEKEQSEVKYDALRNQLNPHFLFNALTSLNSLIYEDQKLASEFLQQLSKIYRYILQTRNKETVTLESEITFLENYISLLKTRFGSCIEFNIEIEKNSLDKGIVPVISQMLVENVIKHNIIDQNKILVIKIKTVENYFIVENTINLKSQVETSNKRGMDNIKDLYRYLTKDPVMVIDDTEIFTVKIPLIQ